MRFRLTALYCGLFIPSSVALIVIASVVTLLSLHPDAPGIVIDQHGKPVVPARPSGPGVTAVSPRPVVHIGSLNLDLHEFLVGSSITLAVMIGISLLLGWLLAGRFLRPVHRITATARDISATDLHQRLDLQGPDDEFKRLGSTLDDLFARLNASFESQRRFVANAAHELRSPLTEERALLQVALADPEITLDSLRCTCEALLTVGVQQERLINALLTLATSERGIERWERFDLAGVTADALLADRDEAQRKGVRIDESLTPAGVSGDRALVECLASNLISNAIQYNRPGGQVSVTTGIRDGRGILSVANTGTVIASADIDRLMEPFQRLAPNRSDTEDGLGLGLSIVAAVANAHGAVLDVQPAKAGGLAVTVDFPAHDARSVWPTR